MRIWITGSCLQSVTVHWINSKKNVSYVIGFSRYLIEKVERWSVKSQLLAGDFAIAITNNRTVQRRGFQHDLNLPFAALFTMKTFYSFTQSNHWKWIRRLHTKPATLPLCQPSPTLETRNKSIEMFSIRLANAVRLSPLIVLLLSTKCERVREPERFENDLKFVG